MNNFQGRIAAEISNWDTTPGTFYNIRPIKRLTIPVTHYQSKRR